MRISNLAILSLLGTAHAGHCPCLCRLGLEEPPLTQATPKHTYGKTETCKYRIGPCGSVKYRTLRGQLPDYIERENQSESNYTSILFSLQAPKDVATYIKHIEIIDAGPGFNCSSARLSYVPRSDEGKPRYVRLRTAGNTTYPKWVTPPNYQIKGGRYLLEVPSTCLTDPQTINIVTFQEWEDVASRLLLISDTSELRAYTDSCQLKGRKRSIKSWQHFQRRVRSLPEDCLYFWKRNYRWAVPSSYIRTEDGKTTVSVPTALNEPMLGDQRRSITMVTLRGISGTTCAEAKIWAPEKEGKPFSVKRTSPLWDWRREVPVVDWVLANDAKLYGDFEMSYLKLNNSEDRGLYKEAWPARSPPSANNSIAVRIPEYLRASSHDFTFILPKDCELTTPVITITYEDDNIMLSPEATDLGKLEKEKLLADYQSGRIMPLSI